MASPVRPRPRPRPRARLNQARTTPQIDSSSTPVPSTSHSSVESVPEALIISPSPTAGGPQSPRSVKVLRELNFDDSHFDRSSRLKTTALAKKAARTPEHRVAQSSEDESTHENGKKRKKRVYGKAAPLPKWTKGLNGRKRANDPSQQFIRIASTTPSSDDDEEEEPTTPRAGGSKVRSPAITPPPPVNAADLKRVAQITRDNLGVRSRQDDDDEVLLPSPTDDHADLDPELAAIARAARERSQARPPPSLRPPSYSMEPGYNDDHPWGGPSQTTSHLVGTGPESVMLRVRLWPLPGQEDQQSKPLRFKAKRSDDFRKAFSIIGEKSGIVEADLIVIYENRMVFRGGTPASLGIFAEADLDAYHKTTYEEVLANRRARERADTTPVPDRAASAAPSEAESDSAVTKLHLTLRSSTSTVKMTVRNTTHVSKLIEHFLKHTKQVGKKARLILEGEDLDEDEEIGSFGLEDGDMLEVIVG